MAISSSLRLKMPENRLEDIMRQEFQYAHPADPAEDAAQAIAEYNLLALPAVIDDDGDIAGIVTVDDAMEILLPKNLRPVCRGFSVIKFPN